ncbi:hypothetical protein BC827DRAFT_521376 [Russula dissimulans]|nr:hypothetical protein BC827DRAFT_521376 [Russula dissimulans]
MLHADHGVYFLPLCNQPFTYPQFEMHLGESTWTADRPIRTIRAVHYNSAAEPKMLPGDFLFYATCNSVDHLQDALKIPQSFLILDFHWFWRMDQISRERKMLDLLLLSLPSCRRCRCCSHRCRLATTATRPSLSHSLLLLLASSSRHRCCPCWCHFRVAAAATPRHRIPRTAVAVAIVGIGV